MTRVLAPALLALVALLPGCGSPDDNGAPDDGADRTVVEAAPLGDILLPRQGTAPAGVLASNESQLSADVSARVSRVHADVGTTVAAGDLLLELDDTDYRLALAQAQARVSAARSRVALAEQRHQRARTLAERRYVSEDEVLALATELQSAKADVDVAEADRRVAARNVEKCRVTAPFDGVVLERSAQVGTLAAAGTALLRLVDLSGAEVEATLQTADAAALAEARNLVFESQGRQYPVHLLRLAGVVERSARTQVARFGFDSTTAAAGSSGTLRWELPAQQLPAQLMVTRDNQRGVFIVEDGVARFIAAPGASEGRPFSVDLPAGARVVTAGQQGLRDGMPVDIASADRDE